ncbi:hypothetical protein KJ865_05235, partial [Myxococcota bacterium]|nr:hypothetical protein [Myxococcota bacterium]
EPFKVLSSYPFKDLSVYPVYVEYDASLLLSGPYNFEAAVVISYKKGVLKVTGDYGPLTLIDEERKQKYAKQINALKLENSERLTALFKKSAAYTLFDKSPKKPLAPLPVDPAPCGGDKSICGGAVNIPGTSLYNVMVEHSCGDGCYFRMVWYDSARKLYLDPEDISRTSKDAASIKGGLVFGITSPKGQGMIFKNILVHYAKGKVLGGFKAGGGWIGGGWRL